MAKQVTTMRDSNGNDIPLKYVSKYDKAKDKAVRKVLARFLRARELLASGGILLIVGLTRPAGFADFLVEAARVIPAKIGSLLHGERHGGEIGVPTRAPAHATAEFRAICARSLPGLRFRRGLYYRVLVEWVKEGGPSAG